MPSTNDNFWDVRKNIAACLPVPEPARDTVSHHFPHLPPEIEELEITLLLQTTWEDPPGVTQPCRLRLCERHQHEDWLPKAVTAMPKVPAAPTRTRGMCQKPPPLHMTQEF